MPTPRPAVEPLEPRRLLASVPAGFADSTIVSGLSNPTAMAVAPDGRIFVAEQTGALRVVKGGNLLATPFATVPTRSVGERGLLGVALDPNFSSNGRVYGYYTVNDADGGPHNRVVRWTASGDRAAGGATTLFDLDPLSSATNHNGGAMHFGADGKLYVAVGDNARPANAPSLGTLHGKMLRLNPDGSIPTDNPFYRSAGGDNRAIWASGLRNPFTFAVSPRTGQTFINDVGQAGFEEVNRGRSGADYGWPATEGYHDDPRYAEPVHAYGRSDGRAIAGGAFYDAAPGATLGGASFPSQYRGDYFFADFASGFIRTLDVGGNSGASRYGSAPFATGLGNPVDLDVAPDGALLYLQRSGGKIGRIAPTVSARPTISEGPRAVTVGAGEPATFAVSANGPGTLSYAWQRDGRAIPGATGRTYTLPAARPADDGASFRVVVTNAAGSTTSGAAGLTVRANQAPTATITSPSASATAVGGQRITFGGTGFDPEDGALPGSALTWRVDYVTGGQVRPFVAPFAGPGGSFTPHTRTPYTAPDVLYRVTLTATDSDGAARTVTRDVRPRTSRVTLKAYITGPASAPPGAFKLTLDGQPTAAPASFVGVEGVERTLGVPAPQVVGGVTYRFDRWADGGPQTRDVATPAADATYIAYFRADVATPPVRPPTPPVQPPTPPVTPPAGGRVRLPSADATVRGGASSGRNYGGDALLLVKKDRGPDFDRESAIKFDLSGLTLAPGERAVVRLTGRQHMPGRPATVVGVRSSGLDGWGESTVTWDRRPPQRGDLLDSVAVAGTSARTYDLDVTAFVRSELSKGHRTATLVLFGIGENEAIAQFDARSTATGPRLVLG